MMMMMIMMMMMMTSPGRCYSRRRKAAEEEADPGTPGKWIWSKKCGRRAYSWRKMEATAQDRAGWSRVVCGLCLHWDRQGIL